MDLSLFDFHLPEHLIAQHPPTRRQDSRLLVYDRKTKRIEDRQFSDIGSYLHSTDVLIRNNTKVIPARLYGEKVDTHAHVELILLDDLSNGVYRCLVGNAKVVKQGTMLRFGDGRLTATCLAIEEEGLRIIQFHFQGVFLEVLESLGEIPLPPYIKEHLTDQERYQPLYAKVPGSAAAPTAGFHFTADLFETLVQRGIAIEDITLQIGLGTFKPVKVDRTEDHIMHVERYTIADDVAQRLNTFKQHNRRLIAIGTTSCRTLEANRQHTNEFHGESNQTNLFITPGYQFQAIDALITNFHLPKSTLVMLVSALIGREEMQRVYAHAITQSYRFFSFGDAMFIV
jgi:S-adenosylmethionine:tRNA ribosyltransferase-isomerase